MAGLLVTTMLCDSGLHKEAAQGFLFRTEINTTQTEF